MGVMECNDGRVVVKAVIAGRKQVECSSVRDKLIEIAVSGRDIGTKDGDLREHISKCH